MEKIKNIFNRITHEKKVLMLCIAGILASMIIVMLIVLKLFSRSYDVVTLAGEAAENDFSDFNVTGTVYDVENIVTSNGFKYYYEDGKLKSRVGIDVSYAQKEIDWNKVSNAGVEFAIIRMGYRGYESGILHTDEYFHKNMSGAASAHIETGVYFFSQAVTVEEAEEEAKYVLNNIGSYDITYPVVFDWEPITDNPARTDNISGDVLNECALAFCNTIKQSGYKPAIYASLNLLRKQYNKYDIKKISEFDLWLAEYKDYPEYPYSFKIWQYSNTAMIDGIKYATDVNVYFDTE